MSTQKIEDYLTKQLFISKNIVTYRSLSREFEIHVNQAKNELAAFHTKAAQSSGQTCSATYLISGEFAYTSNMKQVKSQKRGDSMDIDTDPYASTPSLTPTLNFGFANGSEQDTGELVVQSRLTVVGEAELEDARAKYAKVASIHVYSLSPAPVRDADLLCEPTRRVRDIDNLKGAEMAKAVGRIVGESIEMKTGVTKAKGRVTVAPSSQTTAAAQKLKPGPSAASTTTASVKAEDTGKELVKDELKKPVQTGKLNFFSSAAHARTKEKGKESLTKSSSEAKGKMFFGAASSSKSIPQSSTKGEVTTPAPPSPPSKGDNLESTKRGTKRKSTAAILSSEEEDQETMRSNSAAPSGAPSRQSSFPPSNRSSPQPTRALSKLRLHKGAILSDEDDDDEQPRKTAVKKSRWTATHDSDDSDIYDSKATKLATRALKSMMDIEDDYVEKISRKVKVEPVRQEEEEETEPEMVAPVPVNRDEDVNMSDDTVAKPKRKPRKKVNKKIVPLGRNGLKKRRVMKSRTRRDEKGYSVTEDYSSYESVEEEEEEEEEPKRAALPKKGSNGKKAASGKEEKKETIGSAAPDATAVTSSDTKPKPTAKTSSTKPSANKSTTKGGQKQKSLNTFFGPPKPRK